MEAPPPSRFSIRIDNFVDDDTGTTFYRTSCDLLLDLSLIHISEPTRPY